ncbi:hypothetical protein IEQ44_07430 [Nocardioides sp. Y6]|uniref:Uncharacterized protein n=1 Tax=Nocardioides malaquae TaxID=2773426 RepID=A0ABR9RSG5_9ACTN|nr:hypothetical protein [Nocardioides malaquae]MBE7324481.1 hypothetical protein [Nocardioides malaquae]
MTPDLTPELRQSLEDHLRIWRVDPVGHTETLVRLARRTSSVAGVPSLTAVGEHGEEVSRAGFARLVGALEDALGLEALSGVEAQVAAVQGMVRRLLADEVSPRELTYWVTRVVGLRGGRDAQELMALEEEYCERLGQDVTDLDARVRAAAERLADAGPEESRGRRTGLLARWRREGRGARSR